MYLTVTIRVHTNHTVDTAATHAAAVYYLLNNIRIKMEIMWPSQER